MNKITPLIVIAAVCFIALLFLSSPKKYETPEAVATEDRAHWKLLDEPNVDYQALFPTPPKAVFNNSIDPKTKLLRTYKLYVAEALDTTLFLITRIQFPKDYNPSEDPTTLETIVNELVANGPTNALKNMTELEFNGDQAVKFTIENDNKMVIMGLAFIHGQSIFILSRVSTEKKVNQNEFDYFVKSFKFKNLNPENPAIK